LEAGAVLNHSLQCFVVKTAGTVLQQWACEDGLQSTLSSYMPLVTAAQRIPCPIEDDLLRALAGLFIALGFRRIRQNGPRRAQDGARM
jgi:hypothetical protein